MCAHSALNTMCAETTLPEPGEESESAWNRAMRRGDLAAAWAETDRVEAMRRREEREGRLVWQPYHLLWNGTPFTGKRVLVRCNHGLGDTLQFIRFVPRICAVAEHVTVLVQPALVPLLQAQYGMGEIQNGWQERDWRGFDVEVEIMELAYALRCRLDDLSTGGAYLRPPRGGNPVLTTMGGCSETEVKGASELRVGLHWAASTWDERRSISLRMLDLLGDVHGVRFYSLQQGDRAAELASSRLPIVPLHESTGAIEDAARAVVALDLVITVDCMLAHLAGALGTPVWLLLRKVADWRWVEGRSVSPWYPQMRLFRQPREGDWASVVQEVRDALAAMTIGRDHRQALMPGR